MTDGWTWEPTRLCAELEAFGYDVDAADATADGGSLTARRDRGLRSHVVVVDAGGRVRGTVTVALDEAGWADEVAGVPVRVVRDTRRTVTVTALLEAVGQFAPLVMALDRLAATAPPGEEATPGGSEDGW